MAFSRRSRAGFKRRSAMKMLHTAVDSAAVPAAIVAGNVIGYTHITKQLAAKYGRNMPQACTYRVVGLRCTFINLADNIKDVGGTLPIQVQWIAPSRHRVAAHERILREYVEDVRDDSAQSRGRQLYVALDSVQPVEPQESVLLRNDVVTRVHLLGASGAGNLGVFADYNAQFPKHEGTGALYQPDQDLFTVPASEVMDSVTGHATLYSAPYEVFDGATVPANVMATYNGPLTVWDWEWWAPAGTYLPVMCGILKLIASDSFFPFLQGGTAPAATGERLGEPMLRGSLTLVWSVFVEGWTPLSKK